jgi:hypothetical protein
MLMDELVLTYQICSLSGSRGEEVGDQGVLMIMSSERSLLLELDKEWSGWRRRIDYYS